MGLKVADLLKWKTSMTLRNAQGMEIDAEGNEVKEGEEPLRIYLRIIGDHDLTETYRIARVASAKKRNAMKNKDSMEYLEITGPIMEATKEECIAILKNARTANLEAEARSAVERPDLPELDEFAADPDAPTLEEQEKLDAAIEKIEAEYEAAVEAYIKVRTDMVLDVIKDMKLDSLRTTAAEEIGSVIALGEFYSEVLDQKAFRGAYLDKSYKERAFDSIEDFKSADGLIKQQIIDAYVALEQNPQELKN